MKKFTISKTKRYRKWADKQSAELIAIVDARLDRVVEGNFGDHKWFGEFGELRFKFSKGCRIYYTIRGNEIILLLLGGDKSSQKADFGKLKAIMQEIKKNKGDL